MREVMPCEHIGRELAEIENGFGTQDLVHERVDQRVERVRVERDVGVERTRRVELEVDAAAEQFHDVEVVKHCGQRGHVKSALLRCRSSGLIRRRSLGGRAFRLAFALCSVAVDAVLEVADEPVEERAYLLYDAFGFTVAVGVARKRDVDAAIDIFTYIEGDKAEDGYLKPPLFEEDRDVVRGVCLTTGDKVLVLIIEHRIHKRIHA